MTQEELRILSESGKRQKEALVKNYEEILEDILELCDILEKLEENKECIPLVVRENLNYCIEAGDCNDIYLDELNGIAEDLKMEIKNFIERINKKLEHSGNGYDLKKDLGIF